MGGSGDPIDDPADEEGYDQDIVQVDTLRAMGADQDAPDQDAVEERTTNGKENDERAR